MLRTIRFNSSPSVPAATGRPRPNEPRQKPQVLGPRNRSLRWNGPALTGRTAVGRGVRTVSEDTGPTIDRTLPDISGPDGERTSGPAQVTRAVPAPGNVPSPAVFARCRSLSSASYWASPDRKSPPSHHERRRESADRTGHSYIVRRDGQLSPKVVKPSEKRTITVISSPAGRFMLNQPQKFKSRQTTGRLQFKSRHRWRTARQVPTRRQVTARP